MENPPGDYGMTFLSIDKNQCHTPTHSQKILTDVSSKENSISKGMGGGKYSILGKLQVAWFACLFVSFHS